MMIICLIGTLFTPDALSELLLMHPVVVVADSTGLSRQLALLQALYLARFCQWSIYCVAHFGFL